MKKKLIMRLIGGQSGQPVEGRCEVAQKLRSPDQPALAYQARHEGGRGALQFGRRATCRRACRVSLAPSRCICGEFMQKQKAGAWPGSLLRRV